ncbi:hypothetical protein PIB30_049797 [Stylosanthes scabra]|uniref:Uncharacterized protein n=1 Tax=Stylosanthes scabra TaxID=79078 RepID=A0ABU6QH38_9FABA|nr:hypothetical protein [Stylosanthes scabra]
MPTSLGISETRNWRIGGEDERLNMRMAMDCAWVLDGAIKDRVCALSLASRIEGLHEMGTVMDGLSPRGEIMRGMRM